MVLDSESVILLLIVHFFVKSVVYLFQNNIYIHRNGLIENILCFRYS
jgi:hypothetical protein